MQEGPVIQGTPVGIPPAPTDEPPQPTPSRPKTLEDIFNELQANNPHLVEEFKEFRRCADIGSRIYNLEGQALTDAELRVNFIDVVEMCARSVRVHDPELAAIIERRVRRLGLTDVYTSSTRRSYSSVG